MSSSEKSPNKNESQNTGQSGLATEIGSPSSSQEFVSIESKSKTASGRQVASKSPQASKNVDEYLVAVLASAKPDPLARSWVELTVRALWQEKKPPTVRALASSLQVSERHLMRVVGRLTGKSVSEIRREVRMHHASNAVEDSSFSIVSIARSFGYSSTSGFCRDFRRVFRCAPLEWRANQKLPMPEKAISKTAQEMPPKRVLETPSENS
ncbi:MAG: helix-turn-helix transcriptional regulator [Deltaproteobacteria bacterium]|nr:helix-turn-helix transcriptional regulator [Deltaproteobacteria bacterium]